MSNQLKMADIQAILSLRAQGRSFREIARQLGVYREPAARYVGQAAACSEPASALPGSDAPPTSKPAKALAGSSGALSQCEPWREVILTKATAGLTARRIWQDLRAEVGCSLSYYSICRFVRKLSQATPLPMRRMEYRPREEAQVNSGTGPPIIRPLSDYSGWLRKSLAHGGRDQQDPEVPCPGRKGRLFRFNISCTVSVEVDLGSGCFWICICGSPILVFLNRFTQRMAAASS